MKSNMPYILQVMLAIFFIMGFMPQPPVLAADKVEAPINLTADYLEYSKQDDLVYGRGKVVVVSQEMSLTCDEIYIQVKEETLLAKGHVTGHDKNQDLTGDELTYNLKTKVGKLNQGQAKVEQLFVRGPVLERQGPDKMYIPKGYFTTCELNEPHYRITASRISIYPKKKIVCHNAFFTVGDLPIFYMPAYYQSLKKKKYYINVVFGHSSMEGNFVKVIYGYPLTGHTYGRLYLDYFSRLGWGKGAQFDYNFPDQMIGSLYYYYINQRANETPPVTAEETRKTYSFYHWQRFPRNWIAQANAKVLTDETFNQISSEEDYRQVSNDITSYLAVSKSEPLYTFRLLGERHDLFSSATQKFQPDYVYAPRLTFATNQLRLPWSISRRAPLYLSYSLDTKRGYTQGQGIYIWDGNTQLTLSNSLNLNWLMSLSPSVGISEGWQDKNSATDRRKVYRTQYFTNLNLRTRLSRNIDWDLGHNYSEEIKATPFESRGVIANHLTTAVEVRMSRQGEVTPAPPPTLIEATYRQLPAQSPNLVALSTTTVSQPYGVLPSTAPVSISTGTVTVPRPAAQRYNTAQFLRFRTSTGYNLVTEGQWVRINGMPLENRKVRFDNLVNTLTITPTAWISVGATEEYSFLTTNTQRVTTDFRVWGNRFDTAVQTTFLKSDPGKVNVQNDAGFWLTDKWKINFHLRCSLFNDNLSITQSVLTERGVVIYRDLHCWEVQFSWRKLPLEEEAWIRFNLKAFPTQKIGVYHNERINGDTLEEEWNIRRR